MKLFQSKSVMGLVLVLAGLTLGGCHDMPQADVVPFSPMWGKWTLESIDGRPVGQAERTRYTFERDPENATFNSGIGRFERFDALATTWEGTPIEWEVLPENALVVKGEDGAGTFEFMLTAGDVRTELRLYDAATQVEQVFLKWAD